MLKVDPVTGALMVSGATGGGGGSTGGLTNTELRAAPVPVTGPLTDAQIRASALPVLGPLTNTELRASAVPISAVALPLPAGAATDRALSSAPAASRLSDGTSFYKATTPTDTQPVSVASLPLPAGAAQEHTAAATPASARLSTGAAFYDGRDRNWTITETVPVSGAFWPATQPVSGTFWQTTQPISVATLPLPTGATTETSLVAMSAKLPAALVSGRLDVNIGASSTVPISAASLPLPTGASTETTLAAVSGKLPAALVGGRLDTNTGAWGGTAIAVVTLPTGADGQVAIPVSINAIQKLTYDAGARGIVTGALTANTAKAVWSIEHAVTAVKTVRIRRIMVHARQTTALAGEFEVQITRGTAASSAGTAVTPGPHRPGDAAAEAVVKTLPTIVTATVVDTIPAGGFGTTTALYSPPVLIYDWQEGGETKPYILRAGTLDSLVINIVSTVALNLTLAVSVDFTEES